jgi:acetyl-CoA synthetase
MDRGLIDVLLPSWHHGVPVLAYRARKFDPEQAFYMMAKYGVRNVFMPPQP